MDYREFAMNSIDSPFLYPYYKRSITLHGANIFLHKSFLATKSHEKTQKGYF
jgi:hypothetical protein